MKVEMFSEHRIAFMQEVNKHPKLVRKLAAVILEDGGGVPDEGLILGVVAAEFMVKIDGTFSPEKMDEMYEMFTFKLREARKEVILH